jgi:hypothetical protein
MLMKTTEQHWGSSKFLPDLIIHTIDEHTMNGAQRSLRMMAEN